MWFPSTEPEVLGISHIALTGGVISNLVDDEAILITYWACVMILFHNGQPDWIVSVKTECCCENHSALYPTSKELTCTKCPLASLLHSLSVALKYGFIMKGDPIQHQRELVSIPREMYRSTWNKDLDLLGQSVQASAKLFCHLSILFWHYDTCLDLSITARIYYNTFIGDVNCDNESICLWCNRRIGSSTQPLRTCQFSPVQIHCVSVLVGFSMISNFNGPHGVCTSYPLVAKILSTDNSISVLKISDHLRSRFSLTVQPRHCLAVFVELHHPFLVGLILNSPPFRVRQSCRLR